MLCERPILCSCIQSKDRLDAVLDKCFDLASKQDGWVHISIKIFHEDKIEK